MKTRNTRDGWTMGIAAVVLALLAGASAGRADRPPIFPLPQEIQEHGEHFVLDETVAILIPEAATEADKFLARTLAGILAERWGVALKIETVERLPGGRRAIVMGPTTNPLIRQCLADSGLSVTEDSPGAEGYALAVGKDRIVVAGCDDRGAFYGMQSLRQAVEPLASGLRVRGIRVRDWPLKPFRGIRMFVPGPDNIPFFKRFLRDFMAQYKFNQLVLEMNAVMRLDRHPELNAGWIDFARDMTYTRRDRPDGPNGQFQDSSHHDAGDGRLLDKAEVADLVAYARRHHIEVTPEIPSLAHTYYLLTRNRELAEIQDAEWPDTYCPLHPDSRKLLFDVLDEYIEVMQPKMVHIGRDEWRMPVNACPRCTGRDYRDLFLDDLLAIHGFLQAYGIRMAMWGDHLLESVAGVGVRDRKSPTNFEYKIPGALTPTQVADRIPKDILVFNWFWNERRGGGLGEGGHENDRQVQAFGFEQVYGNFQPAIQNFDRRHNLPGLVGGAPSSWAATTEFNFGKDLMLDFLGSANLVWSSHWPDERALIETVQGLLPEVRRNLRGQSMPSEDGNAITPLDIVPFCNVSSDLPILGADLGGLRAGRIEAGARVFALPDGRAMVAATVGSEGQAAFPAVRPIPVGRDVSSLLFLHACARPAVNERAYRFIYNFDDSADLLGSYEIEYADGLIAAVPIRYGVNILEWQPWQQEHPVTYCYEGDAVVCSESGTRKYFYAFEWRNPRMGVPVKEVRLKGSTGAQAARGRSKWGPISDNAIALIGLSAVEARRDYNAVRAR